MITDKFGLKLFFEELIKQAIEDVRYHEGKSMGFACDKLLEDMCIRQEPFLDRIIGDYSRENHEYRLNNAGLKMYWEMCREGTYHGSDRVFKCSISGDQAKDYPWFVASARMLLKSRGCNKR